MKSSPAGLYLWAVQLYDGHGEQLWITTAKPDAALAAQKTKTFLRAFRKRYGCSRARVQSINAHGTIDA